ncbi:endonuclease/exonuclease/phosphatase family protein [Streptomyces sp. NBC_01808]|uniref:endonuclease/exonuclease/phosphatase family protein n=1 Tax=Streptomyces sp. NBC_01808 TaxID=2975947 RepID=UPI002DD7F1E5|nr:endonuclease/exonuclease/phosphatase family protein [Streptomyces sp. NBC_01808]WSA37324.1 endonuclease/exonuclease/phosphatase family protein [Streptomyces sp. NBC_01808]
MLLPDLPASRTEPDGSAVVRLLSYNIRSMRDDTAALARVIRACAPDVVCIQEAPRFFRWRKKAARLARATGLLYVTGGATSAGPMLLAGLRAHVERTDETLLPRTRGLHQRGLATAVLRFGDARLAVVSTHLSLAKAERYEQAGLVLAHVRALGEPHVAVAGDLNERPKGPAFRRLAAELQDGWVVSPWGGRHTSTALNPRKRIDAVLAADAVEVLGCGVPEGLPGLSSADLRVATDHLPVLAVLRVPAPDGTADPGR